MNRKKWKETNGIKTAAELATKLLFQQAVEVAITAAKNNQTIEWNEILYEFLSFLVPPEKFGYFLHGSFFSTIIVMIGYTARQRKGYLMRYAAVCSLE